jgi:hypothetical protein
LGQVLCSRWYLQVHTGTLRYMPDIRLSLSDELLAHIDNDRGKVPRTVWIRDAIEATLSRGPVQTPVRVAEPKPSKTPPARANVAIGPSHCEHPRSHRQVHGWGTLCGVCGVRL